MHKTGCYEMDSASVSHLVRLSDHYRAGFCADFKNRSRSPEPINRSAQADQCCHSVQQHAESFEHHQLLSLGGVINAEYVSIPAIAVRLPAAVVEILALDPSIAYISPDRASGGNAGPDDGGGECRCGLSSGLYGLGHRHRDCR